MTFLGQPAYDEMLQAMRVALVNKKIPITEKIVAVTNLADSTAHYKYISMSGDDFDCIAVQIECTDGSGAGDVVTFSWDSTNDPETDPTDSGIQWTADDDLWSSTTISNSAAALDRRDKQLDDAPTWYRLTYQRTSGTADDADFEVKITRWKR
jgi:hypothetical protein